MARNRIFIVLWYLTLVFPLFGQRDIISFERISDQQGISQSTVTCIYQGRRGFIWFGTYDGLNRYDGQHFKIYKEDPLNPYSLSHVSISTICECKDGEFWIGTSGGGLNRYDREKERFYRFRADPSDTNSLSNDMIRCVIEDHSGNLWIASWGWCVE